MENPREGDLRVWWIPQIPAQPFEVAVRTIREGHLILETLALYDLFQYDNNIKPDYSNAGGLDVFEEGEWVTWYDEESGADIDELERDYPDRLVELTKARK